MKANIGSLATAKVAERLTATNGTCNGMEVRRQNVAVEMAERSGAMRYPAIQIYCEKVVNSLEEKFRAFSGLAAMAIEVRTSSDRVEGLQEALEAATDPVTSILSNSRGDWGDGLFYNGGYQVSFGAAKHGGKNFIQAAKVTFEIGASIP